MSGPYTKPDRVYVLSAGSGVVKIGASCVPKKRASALGSQAGYGRLTLHATFSRPKDALLVERTAHWHLRDKWEDGEWFNATVADAISAVEWAADVVDRRDRAVLKVVRRLRRAPELTPSPPRDWAKISAEMDAWAEANPEEFQAMVKHWSGRQ